MAEVTVLVEGYDRQTPGTIWHASPSVVLVQEKNLNIIVDPGINRELLFKSLQSQGLTPEDIDFVLITHYHVDHFFLVGIFPKAKALDSELIFEADRAKKHKGVIPGTSLKIIKTPGHEDDHCSLLVKTGEGVVAIAGDVFWWSEGERQDTSSVEALVKHKDRYAKDEKKLIKSRKKLLKLADYIIPGHGKMFRVKRQI